MASELQREHLARLMRYLIAHEPQVHYAQRRPMLLVNLTEKQLRRTLDSGGAIVADCSEMVTALAKWAGLADPSGLHYNGTGNSATMHAHLPHYRDPNRARVGAIVTYGLGGRDHVCMVLEPGRDPLLFSHGQERGPIAVRYSAENRAHGRTGVFCSVAAL